MNSCSEENHTNEECCIDIQQEIIKDENYKASVFSYKISIAEIELFHTETTNANAQHDYTCSDIIKEKITYLSPPLSSRTVLIL